MTKVTVSPWPNLRRQIQRWLDARRARRLFGYHTGDASAQGNSFTWEEIRLLPGFSRITHSDDGKLKLKYTAIDQADRYVHCSCGERDCWTKELLPLREHMAALYRAINACGYAEQFQGCDRAEFPWPGVTDAIQMAASLDDVFTDPAYVDDSEAYMFCESVADFDKRQGEYAAKYTAAMIIFNFVWNAYEAAIEISAGTAFPKDKSPVRARRIFANETKLEQSVTAFAPSHGFARRLCSRVPELAPDIAAIASKYNLRGAAAAAELCRLFRNHIVHGRDVAPTTESYAPSQRFYAVIRLVLLLIQLLVMRRLLDRDGIVPLSIHGDGEATKAGTYLGNLHRREELWFTPDEYWFDEDVEPA